MKPALITLVASLGLLAATAANAQFRKPEDAVEYRQSAMFMMGQHFGRVGAMAAGRAPFDAKAAADNAAVVLMLSKLPFAGFGPDTDMSSRPSAAKAEIWKEADKFKKASEDMQAAAVKLDAAAKGGNFDEIKAAFGATAKTCKACHDSYKDDKKK
ncbi:MAG TPA: cytochrome c [Burkholderiaceae bacterium]